MPVQGLHALKLAGTERNFHDSTKHSPRTTPWRNTPCLRCRTILVALEPHIDAKTMEIHHDKHHQAYVTNLNNVLKDHPDHQGKTIEDLIGHLDALPESIRTAVRNNGGGHANHSLFWQIMKPGGGGEPTGVAQAITADLGGFAAFKEALNKAAVGRFGSGWAWLVPARTASWPSPRRPTRIARSWKASRRSWASTSGNTPMT